MIGRKAEDVLNRAVRYAFERRHEYFTLEHVLLSLLEETEILEVIQASDASYVEIKKELEKHLDNEVPKSRDEDAEGTSGDSESDDPESEEQLVEHPVATLSIQRLIQRALFHVQSAGKDEIQPIDLFVAMFQSKDSFALHLLAKQGIQRLDVLNYVSHGATGKELSPRKDGKVVKKEEIQAEIKKTKDVEVLEAFTVNLNEEAKEGRVDPLVGRKEELERMVQTLCRRRKNNPILVGEAGVGKTAMAEGLAYRIVKGDVPSILKSAEIYSLDLGSLLAGAKFRGDFEQRLKRVLKSLQSKKSDGAYPVLFIDEIHTIIGAGAVNGGAMDAANLLKPFLSRGDIQCIGSTTYAEYRNVFEKDHALARRFQKIEINEPTSEEAIKILDGLKTRFEKHHGVTYAPEAIRAAVDLSVKHLTDRFLPDKAIDVIDEVGARSRIKTFDQQKEDQEKSFEPPVIGEPDIEEMISKIARIPARSVSSTQKARLKNLKRDLKLTIFGQDHAIEAMVTAIQLARSGLRTGERPVGSFLFCGPTGVGKTELSKQLAKALGIKFLRFDMSEYMEKHTVSRLIGAPPGYVGFEQNGLLTEAVMKNPHSVILLDEIEKAHMDVWNILLQVMDHGFLTDNNGRKSDFRNTILILTSNVGTRESDSRKVGIAQTEDTSSVSKKDVERTFSPEFRNRLDSIVYFDRLDPLTIGQIVGKQLLELESQLLAKSVEVEFSSEVREWLAQNGYDPKMGARPMARLIQDKIKRALSEEILFGSLEGGGKVKITLDKKDEVKFEYEPNRAFTLVEEKEKTKKD